jgi:hypothetical protein
VPDVDPVSNSPHLAHRLGVDAASHPSPIGQHERSAVLQLEQHISDLDDGAVRRFVHELEYELGPFRVSPWRVLDHLAGREISREREKRREPVSGAEASGALPASEIPAPVPVPQLPAGQPR